MCIICSVVWLSVILTAPPPNTPVGKEGSTIINTTEGAGRPRGFHSLAIDDHLIVTSVVVGTSRGN